MLLLRIGKYKSLWEASNPITDIVEAEFTNENGAPDLALSVYKIEAADVVRAFVEHAANRKLRPPKGRTNVDLAGSPAELRPDPIAGHFSLIRESHCELLFSDAAQLTEFVTRVRAEISQRAHSVSSADVKSFVRGRLAAQEPEWVSYVAGNPAWNL